MTNSERIDNLKQFGYTEREAAFLCLAALHSGYFLRRQFLYFTGKCIGKIAATFIDRALEVGHVKPLKFRADRIVYHLASKPLYTALNEPDNRHRREHQPLTIKSRLMALDFVLQHQAERFFATEREKLSFFCDELGIAKNCLPVARYRSSETHSITERYFVDKLPIYTEPDHDASPAVRFCYIDEGLHSTSGFERYLDQYASLFSQLSLLHVHYVSCFADQFERARRLFERRMGQAAEHPTDPQIDQLLSHLRDRAAFEKRDFSEVTQAKLKQYREALQVFSGERYERLFERWKSEGDAAVASILQPEARNGRSGRAEFFAYRLAFQYDLFGTLANGNWKGNACHAG